MFYHLSDNEAFFFQKQKKLVCVFMHIYVYMYVCLSKLKSDFSLPGDLGDVDRH